MEIQVTKLVEVGTIDLDSGSEDHWIDLFGKMAAADFRNGMTDHEDTHAIYEAGEVEIAISHRPVQRPQRRHVKPDRKDIVR